MNDQYLWDRSGETDPEIKRMETLLRPLGDPGTPRRHVQSRTNRWMSFGMAAAAAALVCAGVALYFATNRKSAWETPDGRLYLGQWVTVTQPTQIRVAAIGNLNVAPGSRLRIESSREGNYRARLQYGKLDALILAPPRQFFVDTPSAVAVDLGCAYSLEVDRTGETRVSVRSGWVSFEKKGEEVFIPAGAHCRTSPAFGLGVPVYNDASAALQASVTHFEESRQVALPEEVRPKDGLTLWHLLRRAVPAQRAQVFDQFARVVSLPHSISRDRVIAGDRQALDALWPALQLGDAAFWRQWQRKLE